MCVPVFFLVFIGGGGDILLGRQATGQLGTDMDIWIGHVPVH